MRVYIKNETLHPRNEKCLKRLLNGKYKGYEFSTGLHSITLERVDELNTLVRAIIREFGQTSIYPFITPFNDTMCISFREMDIDTKRFK